MAGKVANYVYRVDIRCSDYGCLDKTCNGMLEYDHLGVLRHANVIHRPPMTCNRKYFAVVGQCHGYSLWQVAVLVVLHANIVCPHNLKIVEDNVLRAGPCARMVGEEPYLHPVGFR